MESDWYSRRKNRINKAYIQQICFVAKSAFDTAFNIYKWANPTANLLGQAVIPPLMDLAINHVSTIEKDQSLEKEYFTAVEDALRRVELHFSHSHGKQKLIQELAAEAGILDPFDTDLKDIIQAAETYQTQYMTQRDMNEILQCFDAVFAEEVAKHERLSHYFTYTNTRNTLDLLKRIEILQTADSQQLDAIYRQVNDIKADTTEIKADIKGLRKTTARGFLWLKKTYLLACDVLLHSTIIFFVLCCANNLFQITTGSDFILASIVLASEILIRAPLSQLNHIKTMWTPIPLQTCFITVFIFLMAGNDWDYRFFLIPLCALAGVSIKHLLLMIQRKNI